MNKTIISQTNTNIPRRRGIRWLAITGVLPMLMIAATTTFADGLSVKIDDFAPETVLLSIGATTGITPTNVITQTVVWDFNTNPFTFTNQMAYSQILWLNDSDQKANSEPVHRPGTYLDDSQDFFTGEIPFKYKTDIPGTSFAQDRLGDLDFEKRYGVVFTDPSIIQDGFPYTVMWATPPSDASIDNGNIQMTLEDFTNPDCGWLFCLFPRFSCHIKTNLWGIDPIAYGLSYLYTKSQGDYKQCSETTASFFSLYIPYFNDQ